MTADEEFAKLEEDIRRLKIEYEVFFNGASTRPPHDTLFRVETVIKRYSSDQSKLSFSQRFRFTNLVQKYAVNAQLWRRKLQEKEEGRIIGGAPGRQTDAPVTDTSGPPGSSNPEVETEPLTGAPVRVVCSNPEVEPEKVDVLLRAMQEAKRQVGERPDRLDAAVFQNFVRAKTRQIKATMGCEKVQFSVSVEDGKVKFKATKAD